MIRSFTGLFVVLAASLAACQPTGDQTPAQFETFALDRVQPVGCAFVGSDMDFSEVGEVLFATRDGDPDFTAYARYGGETLRLMPRTTPAKADIRYDITYDVVDYLNWEIRVLADRRPDGLYDGTMTLLGKDSEVSIIGRCNG
jgi:hypothetical protein